MATIKQKLAAKKMVENGGNAFKAMTDSGYSKNTAKTPSKLTDSRGFREILDEIGLTDELIVSSLVEDIKSKPGNRKAELELAAKIKGMLSRPSENLDDRDALGGATVALVEFIGNDLESKKFILDNKLNHSSQ